MKTINIVRQRKNYIQIKAPKSNRALARNEYIFKIELDKNLNVIMFTRQNQTNNSFPNALTCNYFWANICIYFQLITGG